MESRGVHHFYLGVLFLLVAFVLLVFVGHKTEGDLFFMIGLVIVIDDYYQHRRQLVEPSYRSPLNRLFVATLWRIGFVRRLTGIVDRIFGA